jgi:cyclic pyranopterin phosphate synthase
MGFTHIDNNNLPTMVDISDKVTTHREATAISKIYLPDSIASQINKQEEIVTKKGAVFHTAIIAGTMAVKNTSQLIPFCHPIPISSIKFNLTIENKNNIIISCKVKTTGQTGVEMEALTGASVCALTIYDMCKAISHEMSINQTYLLSKAGGKRNIKDGKLCD